MYRAHRIALVLIGALVLTGNAAQASTITFTSRAAWSAAAGGATGSENFSSFGADTSFLGAPVGLAAGMSIGVLVSNGDTNYNFIDVTPLATSESDVNGTNDARIFTGQPGAPTTPYISFGSPIHSLGADFVNLNDNSLRTRVELYNGVTLVDTLTPSIEPAGTVRFFGFVSTSTITQLRFIRVDNDVFGMDNIDLSTAAPVPEPTSLLLLGTGLGAIIRRRLRARV